MISRPPTQVLAVTAWCDLDPLRRHSLCREHPGSGNTMKASCIGAAIVLSLLASAVSADVREHGTATVIWSDKVPGKHSEHPRNNDQGRRGPREEPPGKGKGNRLPEEHHAVPEPSSIALVGVALAAAAGISIIKRRRARAASKAVQPVQTDASSSPT
jgi:hypothetical protein